QRNRSTGCFFLLATDTNDPAAAGLILGGEQGGPAEVVLHDHKVQRADRPSRRTTIWFTGLPGSGKSTVAAEVERRLVAAGRPAYLLDGDNLRHGLNSDLGFGADDRRENPAGGRGRRTVRRRRGGRGRLAGQPLPGRPGEGPGPARGGRPALHRGVHGHPAGAVRVP